ncbi:phage tail protein [Streptomyces sp. NPDC093223]|uniref:phage tail protein n=1 Tax=Streptomyces sp. NPDC093223 TaxID=3366033 RepID=UPI003818B42A
MKVPFDPMGMDAAQLPTMLGSALNRRVPRSPLGDYPSLGLAMRFSVRVDGLDLGGWSSCRGLSVQFGAREVAQGGNYESADLLPERLSYSSVTLERAVSGPDSATLQKWLADVAGRWVSADFANGGAPYQGQSVAITLFDQAGREAARWTLRKAYPKEWSGPELNADSHSVALERLTLAHCGFLVGP